MALINCPSCNQKISDKAATCSHCGMQMQGLDKDKLASIERENRIKTKQKLMNQSLYALLLFCGGFLFLFLQDVAPGSWQYFTAITCTILGFIFYLITRVRLILAKRKSK
ncbi:MAG: hypothetical protein MK214_04515 [Thalassotalea sp.]|nr:hypothetical protein [Thalassotalea sp.]